MNESDDTLGDNLALTIEVKVESIDFVESHCIGDGPGRDTLIGVFIEAFRLIAFAFLKYASLASSTSREKSKSSENIVVALNIAGEVSQVSWIYKPCSSKIIV